MGRHTDDSAIWKFAAAPFGHRYGAGFSCAQAVLTTGYRVLAGLPGSVARPADLSACASARAAMLARRARIGGTPEQVMLQAKRSLLEPIGI